MATKILGFEVIENSGPNNLRDTLRAKLAKASEVCVAVAFVTESGLDEILQSLRQVAAHGQVRIITGLYQCVTEPNALKTLLRVQKETCGNFSVRLSREPQFHRKFFLVGNKTQATAIIGSSNLTREGLRSGGELDLMVSLYRHTSAFRRLEDAFEKDWQKRRAVPLTAEQIIKYAKARKSPVRQKGDTSGQLKKILGREPSHEKAITQDEPVDYWRSFFSGFVKKRTENIIKETTNWDDRGYSWFSEGGPPPYRIGDRIFMFDFNGKHLDLFEVKDVTRTSIPTPDGRHFAAYTRVGKLGRRFLGIGERNAQSDNIRVDEKIAKRFIQILRERKR
jgi:HKD family nuclease